MELELFLVSAIYWAGLLIVLLWLNARISTLKKELENLKGESS